MIKATITGYPGNMIALEYKNCQKCNEHGISSFEKIQDTLISMQILKDCKEVLEIGNLEFPFITYTDEDGFIRALTLYGSLEVIPRQDQKDIELNLLINEDGTWQLRLFTYIEKCKDAKKSKYPVFKIGTKLRNQNRKRGSYQIAQGRGQHLLGREFTIVEECGIFAGTPIRVYKAQDELGNVLLLNEEDMPCLTPDTPKLDLQDVRYVFTLTGGGWETCHDLYVITKGGKVLYTDQWKNIYHDLSVEQLENLADKMVYLFTLEKQPDFEAHENKIEMDAPYCTMYKLESGWLNNEKKLKKLYSVGMYDNVPAVDTIRHRHDHLIVHRG